MSGIFFYDHNGCGNAARPFHYQALGQRIGVISYVEAMQQRIGLQIQVRKRAGIGHSTIALLGQLLVANSSTAPAISGKDQGGRGQ